MEISRLAFGVEEVAVNAGLIDAVELTLVAIQVCLTQRPGLGEVHVIECVAELDQFVIGIAEALVNLAVPMIMSVQAMGQVDSVQLTSPG